MASLFIRGNGKYYVAYFDKTGRRRWVSTHTSDPNEAHSFLEQNVLPLERSRRHDLENFSNTFLDYSKANHRAGTTYIYKLALQSFTEFVGNRDIRAITSLDVERYKAAMALKLKPATVNIRYRALKAAFQKAVVWGIIESNPFENCHQIRVPPTEPPHLTPGELETLLRVIRDPYFVDVIIVAIFTMLRLGELLSLTWSDVDFECNVIRIRNRRDFLTKNGRPRSVPMHPIVTQTLRAHQEKSTSDFVFSSSQGARLLEKSVSRKFKRAVRAAGLNDAIHFHSLRHTGASWLAAAGVPLFHIQRLLGHSSPTVTQIYAHLAEKDLQDAIGSMRDPIPTQVLSAPQLNSN